ncbi:MAG: protease [Hyphomicrobiales bacterium]|nr:protease [Hyphomicrobiales bacterium]
MSVPNTTPAPAAATLPWSLTVGHLGGTAVRIHITFLLLLAWIGYAAWRTGGADAAWSGVAFMLLLFACVLAHEFGHILMARRFGIQTPDVVLLPIGGVASLERMPERPGEQLAVAVAGPAVNVVIAAVLLIYLNATSDTTAVSEGLSRVEDPNVSLLARLASANIFLVAFNMLPAFPMDGGRVLNALLAMRMEKRRAMQISARIGQMMALAFGFAGLLWGHPLLIFIAIFVYMAAAAEAQSSVIEEVTSNLSVADAMETRFVTIPMSASLAEAVDVLLATAQHEFPVVDGFAKPIGLLTREGLINALRATGPSAPVADALQAPAPSVRRADALDFGVREMTRLGAPAISVVDEGGAIVGLLTMQNIAEMMMVRAARPEWTFKRG